MILTNSEDWSLPIGVTCRLILIRHGEPERKAQGRCYGKLDVGLSEAGKRQVQGVANLLSSASLSRIYTSSRKRATESAEIIAAPYKTDIYIDHRLCEIDFGKFEGLTYDEVAARYPQEYQQWMEHPTEVQFPEGESFSMMQTRVRLAMKDILNRHRMQTVCIATHGGVNRIILADVLQIPPSNIFRLDQSYAGISIIDYYEQISIIRLLNY
jgi:alpha-ribazole phosphatase